MKKASVLMALLGAAMSSIGQISIPLSGTSYQQDFNTLSDTGLNNPYSTIPTGWFAHEFNGSYADTTYRAAYGELAGGDVYSFGDTLLPNDRAFGSVGSGSNTKNRIGTALINNTGDTVTQVIVAYNGEVWRVGNPARSSGADTLHFAYGLNNGSLATGNWTNYTNLNFASPVPSTHTANVAVDGNAAAYRTNFYDTISGLQILNGDTFWLSWTDYNSSSYDDGLSIDSFSVVFLNAPAAPVANYRVVDSLNVINSEYFDMLSDTTLYNAYSTLPLGWYAQENGSNADQTYRAAYGELAGGDLYSFGDTMANPIERALGSLGSGSNSKVEFGSAWINNTGQVVEEVQIKYIGEQWRVGNPNRSTGADTLHFSYAINATGVSNGTYVAFTDLNFFSPVDTGYNVNTAGNDTANQTAYNDTITGLSIQPGDTLWLRFVDYNSSSYDDGLAIDSFQVAFLGNTPAQVIPGYLSIDSFNVYYDEYFDLLATTSLTNAYATLPNGWYAKENGSNADQTYRAAYGELAGGDLYSFGDTLINTYERALGSIGSGSNSQTSYGSVWINNTGQVVENVEIQYIGEQWRLGNPDRSTGPDTLHFSYAVNATDIQQGSYINYPALNFFSPVTAGTANSPVNGNDPANQTANVQTIANLGLQPGDTLWVRFTDFNSASYDDGLSIDSFKIAAVNIANVPTIQFAEGNTYFEEDLGLVSVDLTIANKSTFLTQAEVFIADTGSINIATDVVISSGYVQFPGSNNDTIKTFEFSITNAEPFENQEYFVLGLRNNVNGIIGAISYDTVYINNYSYPQIAISDLASDDATGVADSLGRNVLVEGVVHGVNYSTTGGIDFYVLENGSGINVYSTSNNYAPTAGDLVQVWGQVGQYRGLTRLENLDSINIVSTDNSLETPTDVNLADESTESEYVRFESLLLYPTIAQWPSDLAVTAVNQTTNDTIEIYVSSETDLAGTSAPDSIFSLIGIGSQFNSTFVGPFNDGYRVMAVSQELVYTGVEDIKGLGNIQVYPNPMNEQLTISSSDEIQTVEIFSILGNLSRVITVNAQNTQLNTQDLSTGIYLIKVNTANGSTIQKVVKQ